MIFYDLKIFLQGYVEYLSFTYGADFKLQRDKRLKQFDITVRDTKNNGVSNYRTIMYCETGDIKDKCMVRIQFVNSGMFKMIEGFEYDSTYYGFPGFGIDIKITSQEELQKLLNILEETDFFSKWR